MFVQTLKICFGSEINSENAVWCGPPPRQEMMATINHTSDRIYLISGIMTDSRTPPLL